MAFGDGVVDLVGGWHGFLLVQTSQAGRRPAYWPWVSCFTSGDSPPSHSGCSAVESKWLLVLNSSYLPSAAAFAVFERSCATSAGGIGLKVRAASKAWSRVCWLS